MYPEDIFWNKYKNYIFILGIGFFIYFNALFGAFVWDDIPQIQRNSLIQSLTNIPNLFFGGTYAPQEGVAGAGIYYRPLMSLIFTIIYPFSGSQPFLFHFIQILIHLINGILIFILFKKFMKEPLAFILALIFVIHPLNVEAVSFISGLGEPLFVLFGLSALLLFMQKTYSKKLILISILLLCSLFAKETGIVFLVILASYYILFVKRPWRLSIIASLLLIPLSTYLFLRFQIANVHIVRLPDFPMMTAPLTERIFTMPAIFWFYIKTFFFPNKLFIQQRWTIFEPNDYFYTTLILSTLIILSIVAIGMWIWKTNKQNFLIFLFFTIWFFAGVSVHLQIVPLDFTVADRYFYISMIGLLGLIGVSLNTIKKMTLPLKNIVITFAILLVITLSIRTIVRNTNWTNGLSLYSHDLQYQQNDLIQNALAIELADAERFEEASQHFKELLERNPHKPAPYVNLASVYEDEGQLQQAEDIYKKALSIDDQGIVYIRLAKLLMYQEKFSQAKNVSEEGLIQFPQNWSLWAIKSLANYKLGDKQNALKDAEKAKEILPNQTTESLYDNLLNDNPPTLNF